MARIELRYCTIRIKDGLSGTSAIDGMGVMAGDATFSVQTTVLNTAVTTKIPVGARFTVAGETTATTVHTVTARNVDTAVTGSITFSPVLGPGTYADEGVLTFLPQALTISIGEGDLKYTETRNFKYDLDRGLLDTVRFGDEVPMDVNSSFTYEHITTGTSETISPVDAIKQIGGAAEWVSSDSDECQPYAVDIEITHTPVCGSSEVEVTTFPDFRYEKVEPDFKNSLITISGKCAATEPIVSRTAVA